MIQSRNRQVQEGCSSETTVYSRMGLTRKGTLVECSSWPHSRSVFLDASVTRHVSLALRVFLCPPAWPAAPADESERLPSMNISGFLPPLTLPVCYREAQFLLSHGAANSWGTLPSICAGYRSLAKYTTCSSLCELQATECVAKPQASLPHSFILTCLVNQGCLLRRLVPPV